ncbi:MAG: Arc family DNA-binding protein [SAR324 cluster bacterium]|nr:Arc family DNA-binding protein [SAR324 cluster bacterium]
MPAITVKNIPDTLYENLKLAAQVHHRSMNSEIIACLEKELMLEKITTEKRIDTARQLRNKFKIDVVDVDEIESLIDKGRP